MRGLSEGEVSILTHISRWGSDGYPVHKLRSGKWILTDMFGVKMAPVVFKTKREAVASFEAFMGVLRDAKAGRI
jgi:hypothetical protein